MSGAPPARGFDVTEFEARTTLAQTLMSDADLSALLLTTEPEVRYFSGFQTPFWLSPARPWFLVVPRDGKPVAVIPEIGAERMVATWIDDVRTWPAPRPKDEGLTLLSDLLAGLARNGGKVGLPMGHETHIRMPLGDYLELRDRLGGVEFWDATKIVRHLRMIKSDAEIDKIRYVCGVVSNSFENLAAIASTGDVEREVFRRFRIDLLERGADQVPYLVGGSGPGGPVEIIGPPGDRAIDVGDVLMMDTGTEFDGYFADFDRNVAFGHADKPTREAYRVVDRALDAGISVARPGARASDLWRAMAGALDNVGSSGNAVGRFGHGLGMQLTEWPSNMPGDDTVLRPGMVMTLEPGMTYGDGRQMVHEENLVIRDGPPELLSRRAPNEIPILG